MLMALFLSRTQTLAKLLPVASLTSTTAAAAATATTPIDHSCCNFTHRNYYSKAQLIEIDLESSLADGSVSEEIQVKSSRSTSDHEERAHVPGLRKLEDAIHTIIARRCAPDWLPFVPGSSYWVPPKPRANNLVELVGKLTNPLTEEERLSLTTVRGWPCESFLLQGNVSERQDLMAVEVQVHVHNKQKKISQSEDD